MVSARVLPGFLLALGEVRGESPLLSLLHPRQEGAPVEAWVPPESSSARHWHHGPPWAPEPMGSGGGGGGATGCSGVLVADGLRVAVFFRVVAFLAAGFLRVAVFFRVVAFLAAGFLRVAVFFRVVAFLAAGFLRVAVFFRTAAFVAAVFFRPAGLRTATVFFRAVFLRVALLVRAAALVLLAGIAITFPIVGDNRIHTIGAR